MSDFTIIIPARLHSSRLPKKMLHSIMGKTIIERTYLSAKQSKAKNVIIATDSIEIYNVAQDFGANVVMTSSEHQTGTDRLVQACQELDLDDDEIIVNVQGDEPLIDKENINQVAMSLIKAQTQMSTLCEAIEYSPLSYKNLVLNPNCVKVTFDKQGHALTFSRSPIPYKREDVKLDESEIIYYRHIGLYAYRAGFLKAFAAMEPPLMEKLESLEQLRALYHGAKIHVSIASHPCHRGVDVAEDIAYIEALLND